jgi:membrane protein DedA with SNARE-associated domain
VLDFLNQLVVSIAASPWIYLVVLLLVYIDAFFPPVPSESVVVGVSAVAATTGEPVLLAIGALAAIGAVAGDTTAYLIGRSIGTTRFAWMRRPRIARSFAWARSSLDRRGAMLILVGRYIPVGRIAVNMTAGATGFPLRRFVPIACIAGVTWAAYSIGMGLLAGKWLHHNPVIAMAVAVALAFVVGLLVDVVTTRVGAARRARAAVPAPAPVDSGE